MTTYTTRHDKLEWLRDNLSEEHMNEMFLTELVSWMGEDDFNKFFEHHTSCWQIETPFDEDDCPNEFIVSDDEMVPVA